MSTERGTLTRARFLRAMQQAGVRPGQARHVWQAARRRCTLCGRPPIFIGFWIPQTADQQRALTVATQLQGCPPPRPGKCRIIAYGLCTECGARLPEAVEALEARVLGHGIN